MGFVTVVAMDARTAHEHLKHLISLAQQRRAQQQHSRPVRRASAGNGQPPVSLHVKRTAHMSYANRFCFQAILVNLCHITLYPAKRPAHFVPLNVRVLLARAVRFGCLRLSISRSPHVDVE